MEETATYKIDFLPPGVSVRLLNYTAAGWVNRILERLHPWAAVTFEEIKRKTIRFQAGPHRYELDFSIDPPGLVEVVLWPINAHGDETEGIHATPAARRTLEELLGYRRDDDGNRQPPGEARGDWGTLCRNADAAARQPAAAPLPQTLGGFRPMDQLPPDKRVLFQVENRPPMVGWYDSRDQSYQAVTEYNGRLDLTVGVRPIGWLPID